jgi:hypothetical protein
LMQVARRSVTRRLGWNTPAEYAATLKRQRVQASRRITMLQGRSSKPPVGRMRGANSLCSPISPRKHAASCWSSYVVKRQKIASGAVGTDVSSTTLPSQSITHIAVSSIATSNPAKYSMAVLRWRLGRTCDPESAPSSWGSRCPNSRLRSTFRRKPTYAGTPPVGRRPVSPPRVREPSIFCDRGGTPVTTPVQSICAC